MTALNILPPALLPQEAQPPVVEIHMADDIFIKQMAIAKAGTLIPQHSHRYDHSSLVAAGAVRLWQDGVLVGDFTAPAGILIAAGRKHLFMALADATVVYCIHNLARSQTVEILSEHQLGAEHQLADQHPREE
jgi:quercetin dioxygenase-like cupin family protein